MYYWYQSRSFLGHAKLKVGEHNTRIQELHRDLDGLRGSFEGIAGTMEELLRTMDERLAHSMEELKKILLTGGGNPRHVEEGVTTTESRAHQKVEYEFPTKSHQFEFPKFDGIGLRDWLYQCRQFFEVDETPK